MNSAEAELKRRRERGRIAQSAFRKRQAQAKQSREAENSELKSAIAAIIAEVRSDDRPELQAKIREAGILAGLSQDLNATYTSLSGTSSSSGSLGQRDKSDGSVNASDPGFTTSGSATMPTRSLQSMKTLNHRTKRQRTAGSLTLPSMTMYPDPFQCSRCSEGAAVVLPFLGAGAFTFAGRIFWYLVKKHEAQVHSEEPLPQFQLRKQQLLGSTSLSSNSGSDEPRSQFMDLVSKSPSLQESGPDAWLGLVEARLDYYRNKGKRQAAAMASGVHRHLDPPLAHSMYESTESFDFTQDWLSPVSAEKRLRTIVGDEVFSVMAAPALDRWKRKKGDHTINDSTELIDGFLERLSENFVCRGDGPHWDPSVFDSVIQEWCASIVGSSGALGSDTR